MILSLLKAGLTVLAVNSAIRMAKKYSRQEYDVALLHLGVILLLGSAFFFLETLRVIVP